jgi:amidase
LASGVDGVRIGVLSEGFLDAESDVRDAVLAAVDVLQSLGATASSVSVPEHRTAELAYAALEPEGIRAIFDIGYFGAFAKTYYPASLLVATYGLVRENTDRLMPRRKLNLIASEFLRMRYHGAMYAKAQNVRAPIRRAFDRVFDQFDVLAMPTCLQVAPLYVEPEDYLKAALAPRRYSKNLVPSSFTGHPALSVPCGKSRGLPIGMQLVGPYYADAHLLQVAYAYQHSVDWESQIAVDSGATG